MEQIYTQHEEPHMNDDSPCQNPWYKDGLRFSCTGCGKCCTGSPGYVWVDEQEIAAMASHLGITIELFKRRYIRQRDNRFALIEMQASNFDCVFLRDRKCIVYEARPRQCRTFPWWRENLRSKESWELAAKTCEGINDSAPLVSFDEIEAKKGPI